MLCVELAQAREPEGLENVGDNIEAERACPAVELNVQPIGSIDHPRAGREEKRGSAVAE
jgi:hypothetical protein